MWRSLTFSTMAMWNWRGRQMIAVIDNSVMARKRPASPSGSVARPFIADDCSAAVAPTPSPGPSANTTNRPTARKASSLTHDSKAMAATIPSWCSLASMWRVPNRMAKIAMPTAVRNAASTRIAGGFSDSATARSAKRS